MDVWGSVDPNDSTKVKLSFYVDDVLGGSIWNVAGAGANPYMFTYATVGIAVSTTGTGGSAFDNYSVVPEPSTFALGLLGGLGMLWIARRRKV